jgi:uncharacterized repeat protein (TIGR03803 family)
MKILRIACVFGGFLFLVLSMSAQTFTTLFSWDGKDGQNPARGLVQATNGNLYGTTYGGVWDSGEVNYGTVFKIATSGKLKTLHTFASTDGSYPDGILIQATNGNIYGTTFYGGANGAGTIFKITLGGKLTTLHSFCSQPGCTDGANPTSGLVEGIDGNLYGTTLGGGANTTCLPGVLESGCGTVFKISPSGSLATLYSFCSQPGCTDGSYPGAALIQATNGSFYGTTNVGVNNQGGYGGTIFEISPSGSLNTVYSFCSLPDCADGEVPNGGLVQGSDGNFYGITFYGGAKGAGTAFKITAGSELTTLHSFCSVEIDGACTDGVNPGGTLIQATDGNLYGTTYQGGSAYAAGGTIFQITTSGTLTTLYNFCSQPNCTDGDQPELAGLVQDTNGAFYGVTLYGGSTNCGYGCGTLFSLSTGLGPFVKTLPTSGKVKTAVKITGTDLTGATSVTFNGTAAVFKVVSSSEITTKVPKGATTGPVQVVTPSGTLTSDMDFQVN